MILIRGFQDWYSQGMNQLGNELRDAGEKAEVFPEEQWEAVADSLIKRGKGHGPIILVGFSYGADDVIEISHRLGERGVGVDLLVTIDPVTPRRIGGNVARCVNFYEPNGVWDLFPWLRGMKVEGDSGVLVENLNVRERTDLAVQGTSHATIAANEKVHRAIISLIRTKK